MERVKFYGVDNFHRPVFKSLDIKKRFYGNVHILFNYDSSEEEVLKLINEDNLTYFGSKFDCEPWGTSAENLVIVKEA